MTTTDLSKTTLDVNTITRAPRAGGRPGLVASANYDGVVDDKGRTCGGCVVIETRDDGTAYLYVLAQRNGQGYGPAWTKGTTYPSQAAAEGEIYKALNAQRKRYIRKFCKAAPVAA